MVYGASESSTPSGRRRYNICMICDFFYPRLGGVEMHIWSLSQCLLRMGHKVIIVSNMYETNNGRRVGVRYLANGLKVYHMPIIPMVDQASMPTYFAFMPLFRNILLREKIDIVHGHAATSPIIHESMLQARTMGYRAIYTDHSLFGFADAASINVNKFLKLTLSDVDHAICVSHTCRENLVLRAALDPRRVSAIPNAVDASKFTPNLAARPTDNTVNIVMISRLVYRKGIDLVVGVIPQICAKYQNVNFIIGGDGPKKLLLEEMREAYQLHDRVQLLGAVPHTQVREVLTRGHIFLNTSLTESFCIAILEAACCGCYVVSTRVGGVPEVLPSHMVRFAEANPNSIAEGLEYAIERFRRFDANEFHAELRDLYNWPEVAVRTEKVYAEVMSLPPTPIVERFRRFFGTGKVLGILVLILMSVMYIYWIVLEVLAPAADVDIVPGVEWSLIDEEETDASMRKHYDAVNLKVAATQPVQTLPPEQVRTSRADSMPKDDVVRVGKNEEAEVEIPRGRSTKQEKMDPLGSGHERFLSTPEKELSQGVASRGVRLSSVSLPSVNVSVTEVSVRSRSVSEGLEFVNPTVTTTSVNLPPLSGSSSSSISNIISGPAPVGFLGIGGSRSLHVLSEQIDDLAESSTNVSPMEEAPPSVSTTINYLSPTLSSLPLASVHSAISSHDLEVAVSEVSVPVPAVGTGVVSGTARGSGESAVSGQVRTPTRSRASSSFSTTLFPSISSSSATSSVIAGISTSPTTIIRSATVTPVPPFSSSTILANAAAPTIGVVEGGAAEDVVISTPRLLPLFGSQAPDSTLELDTARTTIISPSYDLTPETTIGGLQVPTSRSEPLLSASSATSSLLRVELSNAAELLVSDMSGGSDLLGDGFFTHEPSLQTRGLAISTPSDSTGSGEQKGYFRTPNPEERAFPLTFNNIGTAVDGTITATPIPLAPLREPPTYEYLGSLDDEAHDISFDLENRESFSTDEHSDSAENGN